MTILLRGFVIGFAIAAPVGPIGALCIHRTLAEGRLVGLLSGLGAATADAIYGAVAAFGLTAVSSLLLGHRLWLEWVGGLFLLYLGVRTFLARPTGRTKHPSPSGLVAAYGSTLALTLSNPVTILAFAAVMVGLRITAGRDHGQAALLVLGVFLGSTTWWVILSASVGASRRWFSEGGIRWVNRIAGSVIAAFGAWALVGATR